MDQYFEKAWELAQGITGSFTRVNARKLWEYARRCNGLMVEIGVDQGRSASILLSAAEITGASLMLVDSWVSVLEENKKRVQKLVDKFPRVRVTIIHALSDQAIRLWNDGEADLIHLDADHWGDNPKNDCALWLPKLKPGGYFLAHDYNVPSMNCTVTEAVDEACKGWEDLGDFEGLGIRRKPWQKS